MEFHVPPPTPGATRRVIVLWDMENVSPLHVRHPAASSSAFPTLLRQFFMRTLAVGPNTFPIHACCHMLQCGVPSVSERILDDFTPHGVTVTVMPRAKAGQADLALKQHLSTFFEMFAADRDRVVVLMSSDGDFEEDARAAQMRGCHVVVIYTPSSVSRRLLADCAQLGIATWSWLDVLSHIVHTPITERDLQDPVMPAMVRAARPPVVHEHQQQHQHQHQQQHRGPHPQARREHAQAHRQQGRDVGRANGGGEAAMPVPPPVPPALPASSKPSMAFNMHAESGMLQAITYSRHKGGPKRDITAEVFGAPIHGLPDTQPFPEMQPVHEHDFKGWRAWYYPQPRSAAEAHTFFVRHEPSRQWYMFVDHEAIAAGDTGCNVARGAVAGVAGVAGAAGAVGVAPARTGHQRRAQGVSMSQAAAVAAAGPRTHTPARARAQPLPPHHLHGEGQGMW